MSNFMCQNMGQLKIKNPTATGKSIQRFLDAHQNGLKLGSKVRKNSKEFRMDRSGVDFNRVLKDLRDNSLSKKTKHYIWYIFPQPVYKSSGVSNTSLCFYVDEEEVILFLKNTQLRKNLNQALIALENRKLNSGQLAYYFSPQGDHYKFASFRKFFLKVINKMGKEEQISLSTQNSIESIKKKLQKLNIHT